MFLDQQHWETYLFKTDKGRKNTEYTITAEYIIMLWQTGCYQKVKGSPGHTVSERWRENSGAEKGICNTHSRINMYAT